MNTNFHYTPAQFLALLQEARRRTDLPQEVAGRLEALCAHAQGRPVSDVCRMHGISRQTFYRWLHRLDARDLLSLADHPKFFAKPMPAPSSLPVAQAGAILSERSESNGWKSALLMVSLSLNVLIIGIGIGLMLGKNIEPAAQPASLIEVRETQQPLPQTGTGSVTLPSIREPICKYNE